MPQEISITEDLEKCLVFINGQEIFGWILEEPCSMCGGQAVYFENYDSEFCAHENKWLHSICGDEKCSYCKNRPLKPLNK